MKILRIDNNMRWLLTSPLNSTSLDESRMNGFVEPGYNDEIIKSDGPFRVSLPQIVQLHKQSFFGFGSDRQYFPSLSQRGVNDHTLFLFRSFISKHRGASWWKNPDQVALTDFSPWKLNRLWSVLFEDQSELALIVKKAQF